MKKGPFIGRGTVRRKNERALTLASLAQHMERRRLVVGGTPAGSRSTIPEERPDRSTRPPAGRTRNAALALSARARSWTMALARRAEQG